MCSFKRKQAISEFLRDGPLETLWGGGGGIFGLFAWEYNSKIIFISMASHLASLRNGGLRASLWNGSLRQQGNGLLEWMIEPHIPHEDDYSSTAYGEETSL